MLLTSLGVVSTYTGVLLIVAAESKHATVRALAAETERRCTVHDPAPEGRCAELQRAAESTDLMGNWGIAAVVLGTLSGAGAAVYLLFPRGDSGAQTKATTGLRVVPLVSPTAGGALLEGSF